MLPSLAGLELGREAAPTGMGGRSQTRGQLVLAELLTNVMRSEGQRQQAYLAELHELVQGYVAKLTDLAPMRATDRFYDDKEHAMDNLREVHRRLDIVGDDTRSPWVQVARQWFVELRVVGLVVNHLDAMQYPFDVVESALQLAVRLQDADGYNLWLFGADNRYIHRLLNILNMFTRDPDVPHRVLHLAATILRDLTDWNSKNTYDVWGGEEVPGTDPPQEITDEMRANHEPMLGNCEAIVEYGGVNVLVQLAATDHANEKGASPAVQTLINLAHLVEKERISARLNEANVIRVIDEVFRRIEDNHYRPEATQFTVQGHQSYMNYIVELLGNYAHEGMHSDAVQYLRTNGMINRLVRFAGIVATRELRQTVLHTLEIMADQPYLLVALRESNMLDALMWNCRNDQVAERQHSVKALLELVTFQGSKNEDEKARKAEDIAEERDRDEIKRALGMNEEWVQWFAQAFVIERVHGTDLPGDNDYLYLLFELIDVRHTRDRLVINMNWPADRRPAFSRLIEYIASNADDVNYRNALARFACHGMVYTYLANLYEQPRKQQGPEDPAYDQFAGNVLSPATENRPWDWDAIATDVLQNWWTIRDAAVNSPSPSVPATVAYLIKMEQEVEKDDLKVEEYNYQWGEWSADKQAALEEQARKYPPASEQLQQDILEGREHLEQLRRRDANFRFNEDQEHEYENRTQWVRDIQEMKNIYKDNPFWGPMLKHLLEKTEEMITRARPGNVLFHKGLAAQNDRAQGDDESAADYMRGEDVFTQERPPKRQRQFRAAAEAMGKLLELNKVHLFLEA